MIAPATRRYLTRPACPGTRQPPWHADWLPLLGHVYCSVCRRPVTLNVDATVHGHGYGWATDTEWSDEAFYERRETVA